MQLTGHTGDIAAEGQTSASEGQLSYGLLPEVPQSHGLFFAASTGRPSESVLLCV